MYVLRRTTPSVIRVTACPRPAAFEALYDRTLSMTLLAGHTGLNRQPADRIANTNAQRWVTSDVFYLMPNTHRRHPRDSTVELSRVGVASASAVCIGHKIKTSMVIHRWALVLLEGSPILRRGSRVHARGSRFWTNSGSLSLCQDDINLIVTCFNAVFKILLM